MEKYIEFQLENGQHVLVESGAVPVDDEDFVEAGAAEVARVTKASDTFEAAIQKIKPVASVIADTFKALTPDELELEFGLKFSAKAGVIITSVKTEMNFNVKMTWKNK